MIVFIVCQVSLGVYHAQKSDEISEIPGKCAPGTFNVVRKYEKQIGYNKNKCKKVPTVIISNCNIANSNQYTPDSEYINKLKTVTKTTRLIRTTVKTYRKRGETEQIRKYSDPKENGDSYNVQLRIDIL